MRSLVFDTGPIITLVTNNLIDILEPLKKKFKGEFLITNDVKRELIDKPLEGKKYKFEALYIAERIRSGIIKINPKDLLPRTNRLLNIANSIYKAHDHNIELVQKGEMETLALAIESNASAIVIDERNTRLLIECPQRLAELLSNKLHTKINLDKNALKEFKKEIGDMKVIRSLELVIMAYELGLLDKFKLQDKDGRELLDSLIWGVRLRGCSVAQEEIEELTKLEGYR